MEGMIRSEKDNKMNTTEIKRALGHRVFDEWAYGHLRFENEAGTPTLTVKNIGTAKNTDYHVPWLENKTREEAKQIIEMLLDDLSEELLKDVIAKREKWFKGVSRSL